MEVPSQAIFHAQPILVQRGIAQVTLTNHFMSAWGQTWTRYLRIAMSTYSWQLGFRCALINPRLKNATDRSNHLCHRLHVDAEGFQKFRRHDVEADGKLQLDQRPRRQPGGNGIEGRIGRTAQLDDFVGEVERRGL